MRVKMACLMLKCLLLSFLNVLCYGQNSFTITRKSTGNPYDIFQVPQLNCTDDGSHCKSYHEKAFDAGERCKCSCPHAASTFGLFGGSWKCIENQKLRTQSGCSIKFPSEYDTSPLKVFKDNGPQNTYVPFKGSECKIVYTKSRFLKCSEKWRQNNISDFNKITIFGTLNSGGGYHMYVISIGESATLKGALISLYFDCVSSCLLFKIAGETTCGADSREDGGLKTTKKPAVSTTQILTKEAPQPTKKDVRSSPSKSSSGVIAAVVIVVLLIIVISLIIGYVLWKRKRDERVWLVDQCLNIAAKFKRPASKAPAHQYQGEKQYDDNNIYEEIPEITFVQGRTTVPDKEIALTLDNSKSLQRETKEQETSMRMGRRSITDLEGYAVPVELNEETQPQINPCKDQYDYALPETERPEYNVLQEPYEQTKEGDPYSHVNEEEYDVPETDLSENNTVLEKTQEYTSPAKEEEMEESSVKEPKVSGLAENNPDVGYQNTNRKTRRRPPSPPRKI